MTIEGHNCCVLVTAVNAHYSRARQISCINPGWQQSSRLAAAATVPELTFGTAAESVQSSVFTDHCGVHCATRDFTHDDT